MLIGFLPTVLFSLLSVAVRCIIGVHGRLSQKSGTIDGEAVSCKDLPASFLVHALYRNRFNRDTFPAWKSVLTGGVCVDSADAGHIGMATMPHLVHVLGPL